MARAVRDAGIAVDVATTNDNDRELLQVPLGVPVQKHGVRYWYFARSARPYTTSTGLAKWLSAQVREYDVVHTHALFSFSTPIAATLARRSAIPYIIRPLGTLARYGMQQHAVLKQLSWMLFEKKLLAHAAAIHFTSEAERQEAERLGKWRSVVVPIGVDFDESPASQRARSDDELVFLFLSRIHPKKRLDRLLHAVAEARRSEPRIRLIVAGAGEADYVSQMRGLSEKLDLPDVVEWAGHVSGPAKARLLQRAHAFVLPSENENFGIAAVEALAAGLPVIVTRGVAIHREVEAKNAGLIVDSSATSVSQALLTMGNEDARAKMSAQARALARNTFSIAAMQRGLIRMYEQVIA
jgi:glycosyltransferase involved in cell wall biosynthesis